MKIEDLEGKTWQELKELAADLDYEKPEDSAWQTPEVIEAIVALTNAKELTTPVSVVEAPPVTEEQPIAPVSAVETPLVAKEQSTAPNGVNPAYATKTFARRGVPFCDTCGASHVNSITGAPVCAEGRTDCPRLVAPPSLPKTTENSTAEFMSI